MFKQRVGKRGVERPLYQRKGNKALLAINNIAFRVARLVLFVMYDDRADAIPEPIIARAPVVLYRRADIVQQICNIFARPFIRALITGNIQLHSNQLIYGYNSAHLFAVI